MSDWFRQNRWLGTFLIVSGAALLLTLFFLFHEKGLASEASARFDEAAAESSRLERGDPFPNDQNTRKMKTYVQEFATSLDKLKEELKGRVLPPPANMQPNEFQGRLRQAMLAVGEKARTNKVKLPDNFALGFEVYTSALPPTEAAPLLGQELAQAELLANILIESRIDSISAFTRAQLPEERGPAASPTPGPGVKKPSAPAPAATAKVVERGMVDVKFTASASAMRRVLNQIATSPQQFFIIRTLHVHNEKEKGPPREQPSAAGAATPVPATVPAQAQVKSPAAGLTFIVGNEHLETTARVELVRFTY